MSQFGNPYDKIKIHRIIQIIKEKIKSIFKKKEK